MHSAQASKSTIDDRKTHKEKRRRTSNTIIVGMDNYLEGYGEDYGESAHILDAPTTAVEKKTKSDKKKKKSKHKDGDASGKKKKSKSAKKLKKEEEMLDREKNLEEIDSPINFEVEVEEVKTNNDIPVLELEETEEAHLFEQKPPLFDEEDEKKLLAANMASGHDEPLSRYGFVSRVSNNVSQSNDSIDALPEYESLTSVSSDYDRLEKPDSESKKGSSNVHLPLASEHYTESIKRLQKSTEEYEEEHFGGKVCV